MSDVATQFLPTLGRTTVWLILTGIATAAILRLARATWPTAHRIGWVMTLIVGWTFLRLSVVIPWYDAAPSGAGAIAEAIFVPQPTFGPTETPSPLVGERGDWRRREALVGEPGEGTRAIMLSRVSEPTQGISNPPGMRFDWPLAALFAWALVMLALIAAWLIGYLRFVRSLPSGLPAEQAWLDQWSQLLSAAGVRRSIPLRVTADLGPMLCRLPRGYELLVPADLWRELDVGQRGAILRHELAHYLRGDVWKSLAARVLALPHWFNPVSWWAVRRFEEAAEWACDRAATAEEPPTTYAKALVLLGASPAAAGAYGSAARGPALAVRIRRLLNLQAKEDSTMKKTLLVVAGLCLLTLSLTRLQLVAKEADAPSETTVEAAQPDTSDSDQKPTTPPTSAEPAKPAPAPLEPVQLSKRFVAERLAEATASRIRIQGDLNRVKLQLRLTEVRKANAKVSLDGAVEYELGHDPQMVQATTRLNTYKGQLADEETKTDRRDDPRLKVLRAKIQKLETNIEDRKAVLRPQLKEFLDTNATENGDPLPTLNEEKASLEASLAEVEKSVTGLATCLNWLEKYSAEQAASAKRAAERQAATGAGEAEPAKASAVTAAAQKMVEEAQRAFEATRAAFDADTTTLSRVHEWSLTWREAAESAAREPKQIVEAAKAHLERVRNVQAKIKALYDAGTHGGEATEMAAANFYVAEAERHLAEVLAGNAARANDAEMQSLDSNIEIANLDGQLKETEMRLKIFLASLERSRKSGRPEFGLQPRQLEAETAKLKAHRESLQKQLELYKNKLQLSERGSSTSDSVTKPATTAPAKAKASASPAAKTTSQPGKDKWGLRYNGKDFDAWAEELRDDLSPRRRREAIQALATFGANGYGPHAAEQIIEAMRGYSVWMTDGSDEGSLKLEALEAFKKMPRGDALPLVMEALKSDNANERLFAVAVVPDVVAEPQDTVRVLSKMLQDPDLQVRRYAVTNIIKIDPKLPELLPVLREALGSEDRKAVGWAINFVGGITPWIGIPPSDRLPSIPALVPELVALLDSTDDQIKAAAENALLTMGPEDIPALEKVWRTADDKKAATKAEVILKRIRERAAKQPK